MKSCLLGLGFLAVALVSMRIFSCRSRMQQDTFENPEASHKILITGTTSEFKDAVTEGIVNRYKDTCQIEIVPPGELKGIDHADYSSIVIMDELRMGKTFGGSTGELAQKVENKDKVILFITAGKRDWQFSAEGIDAITSASEEGEERSVIEKISARIDGLIK
ncbi:MAG: hypothetical protein AMJ92_08535 [candidate division Zixibacteria bacterium SM23_81]|nr:MAG: hypothetical protein AMJ92_08535 [candidate division Zixibacteria bacterium SM23_81]